MIFIAKKGEISKFVLKSIWKTKKFWIYHENKVEDDCQSAIICTTMLLFFLFSLSPQKWIGLKKRKDSKKRWHFEIHQLPEKYSSMSCIRAK